MQTRRFPLVPLVAALVATVALLLAPLAVASADSESRAEARAKRQAEQQARREAKQREREVRNQVRGFTRGLKVQGETLESNIDRVNQMEWNESLADALSTAKETGKLVLHIQALGDLDGFL